MATAGPSMKEIDLLLIGKTGNGKSATGNSILQQPKAFKSLATMESVTKDPASGESEYEGRIIKVVDAPGVCDTKMTITEGDTDTATNINRVEQANFIIGAMERAIAMNVRGYHAFLYVIRFGGRFTEEDANTLYFLKSVFGEDFVRKYCILVVTCGEDFDLQFEEPDFEMWCKNEGGVFKTLYDECDHRAVLFYNKTKDESQKKGQLDNLIKLTDQLWRPGHRYRDENFKKAGKARERVMIETKQPMIRDDTMRETSLIMQKLHQIQLKDTKEQIEPLEELSKRAEDLYHSIETQDKGTGVLHRLLKTVDSLRTTVQSEIKVCRRFAVEKDKWMKEFQEAKKEQNEKINGLAEDFRSLRAEHDKGITEKVVDVTTLPIRATARVIDAGGSWVWRKITNIVTKESTDPLNSQPAEQPTN